MPHWEFPGSDPIDASVDLASGRVTVDCRPVPAATVDVAPSRFSRNAEKLIDEVRVAFDHGRLEVAGPRRAGLFRGHGAFDVDRLVDDRPRHALHVIAPGQLGKLRRVDGIRRDPFACHRHPVRQERGPAWVGQYRTSVGLRPQGGD